MSDIDWKCVGKLTIGFIIFGVWVFFYLLEGQ